MTQDWILIVESNWIFSEFLSLSLSLSLSLYIYIYIYGEDNDRFKQLTYTQQK